ncbi:MAG: type II toxin-antitoxin system HicA family toxin [Polyangiaceae bacterium]
MSDWSATRAERVLAALLRIGWPIARQRGSHCRLVRPGWAPYTFAFHDGEELGPTMLAKIAKQTGPMPGDLLGEPESRSPIAGVLWRRRRRVSLHVSLRAKKLGAVGGLAKAPIAETLTPGARGLSPPIRTLARGRRSPRVQQVRRREN